MLQAAEREEVRDERGEASTAIVTQFLDWFRVTRLTLSLTPHHRLLLVASPDAPAIDDALAARLAGAFARGSGDGLLHLGGAEIRTGLPPLVRGSSLYETTIGIEPVRKKPWKSICTDLAGSIDSLVELLEGRFSAAVMDRICRPGAGLFPSPAEIRFECSCPDFASMCKHVAAVLYGIGARLDERPELLFTLRRVDASEIVAKADGTGPLATGKPRKGRVLAGADVSELFGLEMETGDQRANEVRERRPVRAKRRPSAKKGTETAGNRGKKRKKQ